MKKTLILIAATLLTACSTPADLKRDYPPVSFKVQAGYQLVLKRFVDNHQECAMAPLLPIGQMINDVQNYPDLRMATIVRGASGVGSQTHQVFEITEAAPNETTVSFTQRFSVAKFAAFYERVANGQKGCDI